MSKDPNIWWTNRTLRKRTFQPDEYVGWAAGSGGQIKIPAGFYLVDEIPNNIVDEAGNRIFGVSLVAPEG